MDLAWVGALTLAVLVEKTTPGGECVGNLFGVPPILAEATQLDGIP